MLKRAVGPQIGPVYGADFRSTPVFFLQDDHDYFDNDEATDEIVTFPPSHFMLALARATQHLYYPEFLPDAARPLGLPWSSAGDRVWGVSESFGTIRYGRLAEVLLYDIRRTQTLAGPSAVYLDLEVEKWLKARMAATEVTHVVHVPESSRMVRRQMGRVVPGRQRARPQTDDDATQALLAVGLAQAA